jgi:hypothetical protein
VDRDSLSRNSVRALSGKNLEWLAMDSGATVLGEGLALGHVVTSYSGYVVRRGMVEYGEVR